MNKIYYLAIAAMCALCSCGGGKSDGKVSVDDTHISGALGEYFELVDNPYKYEKGIIDHVSVDLKCIKPLEETKKAYIGVTVLDNEGTTIAAGQADAWSFNDYEILRSAQPGDIVSVKIENHNGVAIDDKPAKIRLLSSVESESFSSYGSSSSFDSSDDTEDGETVVVNEVSGENWDDVLDSFEEYVSSYSRLLKKAQQGDMSAMSEYAQYYEEANELSQKLENAKGSMTSSQLTRYTKIVQKMANAMQ